MQFVFNLFGTVYASKEINEKRRERADVHVLKHRIQALQGHVDFLLEKHFSQSVELKTYDVYTSEDDGQGENCEGGEHPAPTADRTEEDSGSRPQEVNTDVPARNTEEGRDRPVEGEASAGSGEASSCQTGQNSSNSH